MIDNNAHWYKYFYAEWEMLQAYDSGEFSYEDCYRHCYKTCCRILYGMDI